MKYRAVFNRLMFSCLCAWASTHAHAGTYDQVVIFGDSLSDGGTYGSRFTTNPGQTAPETSQQIWAYPPPLGWRAVPIFPKVDRKSIAHH